MWNEMVAEIKRSKPIIGNVLSEVVLKGDLGNVISLAAGNNFQLESLKRNQAYLEEALLKKTGRRLGIKVTVEEITRQAKPEPEEEPVAAEEPAEQPPADMFEEKEGPAAQAKDIPAGLEKIAGKFPGKITKKK
jgi:hypothetical protein